MRLYEHFGNSRGTTKVTVDLKWGMRTEKVRICSCPHSFIGCFIFKGRSVQLPQNLQNMFTIMQLRPEQNLPGLRPPRTLVNSYNNCFFYYFRLLWNTDGRD